MKRMKGKYIYFLINFAIMSAIFLIGICYEEQRQNMSLCFKIYLLGLCSNILFKYIRENKANINFETIFTIVWTLVGIAIMATALFIKYRLYPVIVLYALGSFVLVLIFAVFQKV